LSKTKALLFTKTGDIYNFFYSSLHETVGEGATVGSPEQGREKAGIRI
jgi:hypothetical protein